MTSPSELFNQEFVIRYVQNFMHMHEILDRLILRALDFDPRWDLMFAVALRARVDHYAPHAGPGVFCGGQWH
jgi:hypothetical protein